jgi:tetratricopeptide (TPR) repeat protein
VTRTGLLPGLLPLAIVAALAGCAGAPPRLAGGAPAVPACWVPSRGAGPASAADEGAGQGVEALLAIARRLRAQGDHAGAQARLEQAARQAPDSPAVCLEEADLLVAGEVDLDRAGAILGAIPAAHPGRDATLGRLAELRGDAAAAEAAYARQLAASDDPELRLRRALSLERLGRDAEAIAELERLRLADPANAQVRARLAERYEAAGRLPEAEAELRFGAEATLGRPEWWRRLAAFCTRHGLAEKARDAEARAREAATSPPRALRPLKPTGR